MGFCCEKELRELGDLAVPSDFDLECRLRGLRVDGRVLRLVWMCRAGCGGS